MADENAVELYRKYRPESFGDIVGQEEAIRSLSSMGKQGSIPHFILLTGPSGVGKTTIARILRKKLKCGDADFQEVNAADDRGIGLVRDLTSRIGFAPIDGKCRVWLIDEAHQLTSEAQGAFLKLLEDTPSHVYFMFCTTDPQKLKQTIKTRATIIDLKVVGRKGMVGLIQKVVGAEGKEIDEDVLDKILDVADGSPRKALVLLQQIIDVVKDKQLEVLVKTDPARDAIEIARGLLTGISWVDMSRIIKAVEGIDEKAESIRWLVLAYMTSVALGGGGPKVGQAMNVIDCFSQNFYDTKKAGLVFACYQVLVGES